MAGYTLAGAKTAVSAPFMSFFSLPLSSDSDVLMSLCEEKATRQSAFFCRETPSVFIGLFGDHRRDVECARCALGKLGMNV